MSVSSPPPEKLDSRTNNTLSRPKILAGKMPILNNGIFWAATPALALFALVVLIPQTPVREAPAAHSGIISASNWVVAASDTVLVTRQSAGKFSTLRGRLEAAKGDAITSSSSGVVSQVSVRPGQNVSAGQQIALLTTGIAPTENRTQSSSPAENLQSRAEAAQVAAAQQQEKLESRMNAADAELQRAKERVAIAQKRVADARQLIARLQKGEQVTTDEAPVPRAGSTPKSNPNRAKSSATALRESQKLQSAAEAAEDAAKSAQKSARDAEAEAAAKQKKLKSAQAAAKAKTSASTAAGNTSGAGDADDSANSKKDDSADDNAVNSAAVSSSREIAASAASHAAELKREAARRQTLATQARSKANDAARLATQDLQVFDGAGEAASAPQRKAQPGGEKMTVTQAVRIARNAMKESDAAIKNAERIQKKVESYGGTVASTRQKFDSAAKQLETAQQRMWDSAPVMQTRQMPVNSPRSGIVTWVAAPTTVIHGGEAVASVGRPDRLEVVVEDKTGAWKSLKPDARVLALVDNQNATDKTVDASSGRGGGTANAAPRPVAALTLGSEGDISVPTLARVLFIAPPSKPGQAARIRIAVHNPPAGKENQNGLAPRAFAPGMKVFFSVAQPSKQTAIRIPTASVRRDEKGKTFVAVLAPVENQAGDRSANECRVEWREVFLAPGDGIHNRVKTGLKEGERLALRPSSIYDYTLAFGSQATVSVEQI